MDGLQYTAQQAMELLKILADDHPCYLEILNLPEEEWPKYLTRL